MPTIPILAPKKVRPRLDFDMKMIRMRIYEKGLRLQWEMAAECPCMRVVTVGTTIQKTGNTREPIPGCAGCDGAGVIYHSKQEIRGLVIGAKQDQDRFRLYGEYAIGMVGLTLLPEHIPGIYDRFTLLDDVMLYRETRERTAATTEALRYPIASRTINVGSEADPTVPESRTYKVMYVRTASTTGTVSSAALVEDTDFAITSDGKIDWTLGIANGNAPATGGFYSVSYFCNPVYVVNNYPHAFRDTYTQDKIASPVLTNLPVQVDCLLEFLNTSNE